MRCGAHAKRIEMAEWYYGSSAVLRLQVWWQRWIFAHQCDGDATVCRQCRIVGKQWLAVGPAADGVDVGLRQPLAFEDLAYDVGAVRRQIERAIFAARRHEAGRRVADNVDAQR